MKTKVTLLLIFLALCTAAVAFLFLQKKSPEVQSVRSFDVKANVDSSKVPDIIPSDFPFEDGAFVPQNFVSTSADGKATIAERWFVTSKSLDANFYTYLGYLQKQAWNIKTNVNQVGLKVLGARKNDLTVKIEMSENTQTKTKTVKASFYKDIQ